MYNWKNTCTPMFVAALFTIARTWKQPRCPSTDEWIKKLWYTLIYTMEYYSAIKKEHSWVSSSEVDEPRTCYTERSKSEREKQIPYISTYIWNLEKWYWWTYFQGRNRHSDIENRLMTTARTGEGGTNWESSFEIYMLPYVTNGKLLYNAGSSTWCSVTV